MINYGIRKWSTCFYTSLGISKALTAGKQYRILKLERDWKVGWLQGAEPPHIKTCFCRGRARIQGKKSINNKLCAALHGY